MPFELKESNDSTVVVSIRDDAVNIGESDVTQYFKTLDMHHLVFHADTEPTKFHIRPLGAMEADTVVAPAQSEHDAKLRVFHAGCEKIVGLRVEVNGEQQTKKVSGSSEAARRLPAVVRKEIADHIHRITNGLIKDEAHDLGK